MSCAYNDVYHCKLTCGIIMCLRFKWLFLYGIGIFSCLVASLLAVYLNSHQFTKLHLDGIFKYGDDNTLPAEVSVHFSQVSNSIYLFPPKNRVGKIIILYYLF